MVVDATTGEEGQPEAAAATQRCATAAAAAALLAAVAAQTARLVAAAVLFIFLSPSIVVKLYFVSVFVLLSTEKPLSEDHW